MRKIFLFACLFIAVCCVATIVKAQANLFEGDNTSVSEAKMKELVQKFKKAVRTDDPEIIAEYIDYPYLRPNPIPNIDNKEEFIAQYNMLMDKEIRQEIINSSMSDWDTVGWRGIMLDNGILWLNNEGKLIAINKSSTGDEEYITKWYEKDRKSLYPDLRDYNANLYIFETKQWKGRIDSLSEGSSDYRLVLWRKTDDMSDKPEIVIDQGTADFSGTADNSEYRFEKGDYIYAFVVSNSVSEEDDSPYNFVVYKDDKELSSSPAEIIK